jgi:hypothetical protein
MEKLEGVPVGTPLPPGVLDQDEPLPLQDPDGPGHGGLAFHSRKLHDPLIPREAQAVGIGVVEEGEVHVNERGAALFFREQKKPEKDSVGDFQKALHSGTLFLKCRSCTRS